MKIARTLLAAALLAYLVGNQERITLAQNFCSTDETQCAAECDTPVTFTSCASKCESDCGPGWTASGQPSDGCGNSGFACQQNQARRIRHCTCAPPPQCKDDGASCSSNSECCSDVCNEERTCGQPPTPILIGLETNSRNYHLTSATDGVRFDLNADGQQELVAWTQMGQADSEVAFLAMDRNGNGRIDDGSELFGNVTRLADGFKADNGFEALADLDISEGNGDGMIDAGDVFFGRLRLWIDRNHNGVSEPQELRSMNDEDIAAISTDYRESRRVDRNGNQYRYVGTARVIRRNGHERRRTIFDVILVTSK